MRSLNYGFFQIFLAFAANILVLAIPIDNGLVDNFNNRDPLPIDPSGNSQCQITQNPADLMFILDGSSSVGPEDFILIKEFVGNVLSGFQVGEDQMQVGIVQYSDQVQTEFSLNQHKDFTSVLNAVNSIVYLEGATHTGEAVDYVINHELVAERGRRGEAGLLGVVITDGTSQDKVTEPGRRARALGMQLFAVAITPDISEPELLDLTGNIPSRIFRVDRFGDLQQELRNNLVTEVCRTIQNNYQPPPTNGANGAIISCEQDGVMIRANTRNPFEGRVFVKGHSDNPECLKAGDRSSKIEFKVFSSTCGLIRGRQTNPTGMFYETTVIVSFHSLFITKVDRAFKIRCFFMEAEKTVTANNLEVSMLTTEMASAGIPMPTCTYTIRSNSPDGPIVRYAAIGDKIYHVWECEPDGEAMHAMMVHSCFVKDGKDENVPILDHNGCGLDPYVLRDLIYEESLLRAYQETHAFKFADKPSLFFNCQVMLCMKIEPACQAAVPPSCGARQSDTNALLADDVPSRDTMNQTGHDWMGRNLTVKMEDGGEFVLVSNEVLESEEVMLNGVITKARKTTKIIFPKKSTKLLIELESIVDNKIDVGQGSDISMIDDAAYSSSDDDDDDDDDDDYNDGYGDNGDEDIYNDDEVYDDYYYQDDDDDSDEHDEDDFEESVEKIRRQDNEKNFRNFKKSDTSSGDVDLSSLINSREKLSKVDKRKMKLLQKQTVMSQSNVVELKRSTLPSKSTKAAFKKTTFSKGLKRKRTTEKEDLLTKTRRKNYGLRKVFEPELNNNYDLFSSVHVLDLEDPESLGLVGRDGNSGISEWSIFNPGTVGGGLRTLHRGRHVCFDPSSLILCASLVLVVLITIGGCSIHYYCKRSYRKSATDPAQKHLFLRPWRYH